MENIFNQIPDDTDFSVSHIIWNRSGITYSLGDDFEENTVEFTDPLAYTSSELILHNLETNILGLSYNSITIKKQGTGMFQLGDLVDYEALDGTIYKMLVMGIVYDFSGGFFSETLYSLAKSASQQEYAGNQIIDQTEHIKETAGTSGTLSPITTYEYVSDPSVKINEVEYTIEKNAAGLISKITDSLGNTLKPTISGEITDIVLHNAALWGAVMARGIGKAPEVEMPDMTGLKYYYIPETMAISEGFWKNYFAEELSNRGDMTLSEGALKSGHAVNLRDKQYGAAETADTVRTVYCLAKLNSFDNDPLGSIFSRENVSPSVGIRFFNNGADYYVLNFYGNAHNAGLEYYIDTRYDNSDPNRYHFDTMSGSLTEGFSENGKEYLKTLFSEPQDFLDYHVYAAASKKEQDGSRAPRSWFFYIDGNYIGYITWVADSGTTYCLNYTTNQRNGTDISYLAYAMGTEDTYHTPEMVKANSEWLLKKARGDWKD